MFPNREPHRIGFIRVSQERLKKVSLMTVTIFRGYRVFAPDAGLPYSAGVSFLAMHPFTGCFGNIRKPGWLSR